MVLVSVGVRLAPEVPLWCDCAEVALEPRDRERESERRCELSLSFVLCVNMRPVVTN